MFTGEQLPGKCKCQCKAGYYGGTCDLGIQMPKTVHLI